MSHSPGSREKSHNGEDTHESIASTERDMEKDHEHDEHDKQDSFEEQTRNHLQRVVTDVPPNGGYGWVCVACCFLINAHTWGLNSVRLRIQQRNAVAPS